MNLNVTTNLADVIKTVRDLPKQTTFATMLAINRTGVDAQKFTINKLLPDKFTIRSKWWRPGSRYGFNLRRASKAKLEATLGSAFDPLALHERGGTKRPREGRSIAQPQGIRTDKAQKLTRAKRPRALLGKPKTFIAQMASGKRGIFRRVGKARLPIKLLYTLEPSVRIEPTLDFEDQAGRVADQVFESHFSRAFREAVLTAK